LTTKYESDDGLLFDDVSECIAHENLYEEINDTMSLLDGSSRELKNGMDIDCIQHDSEMFNKTKARLLEIVKYRLGIEVDERPIYDIIFDVSCVPHPHILQKSLNRIKLTTPELKEFRNEYLYHKFLNEKV
jgi:hypothetical protein